MAKTLKTSAQIAASRKATKLGYNSIEDTQRRRPVSRRTSSEGFILTPSKRDTGNATVRDDRRNMTILAWMIRRHLDNVSRFTPTFRIPGNDDAVKEVNTTVKKLLDWHSRRRQFDALKRHGRDEWLRMFEASKVIEGDAAGLKVEGWRLQGIEGDRIRKPTDWGNTPPSKATQDKVQDSGIVSGLGGEREGFCVCKRTSGTSLQYERIVPADEMIFDGYWPDRFDSDRGVSPLLSALNEGADVRETWEWLVLKAKASAIFGLAFTRTGSDEMVPTLGESLESDGAQNTESGSYSTQVTNAIKGRGLINLDLDPGDDVKEIQSSTPNPTVIPFTRELIRSFLLALDIPFTFYDSLTASFSARIADRNEYEESCEWKRDKNIGLLDEIYGGWLIPAWYAADWMGLGKVMDRAKMTTEEVAANLRWVPAGRPWLDRSNEMSGHILALTAGVTSTPRICAAYGEDAYEIADEQREYLERAGQPLLYASGGQVAVQAIMAAMGGKAEEKPPQQQQEGTDNE